MDLPTEDDINPVPDCLDGKGAVRSFLGRTPDDVYAMLCENSAPYSEDFMQMGPVAFCFYAPALLRYLQSSAADDDDLFADGTLQTFRSRILSDGTTLLPAVPVMRGFCSMVARDFQRLGFRENYRGRVARRIREVEEAIRGLTPAGSDILPP